MKWEHLQHALRGWLKRLGLEVSELTPPEAVVAQALADGDLTPPPPIALITTPGCPLYLQRQPRGIQ